MATIDTIPNGLIPGQPPFPCSQCRSAINGCFVELRLFDATKPKAERSELIACICLDCQDRRDSFEVHDARKTGKSWRGYADLRAVRGLRAIIDGTGKQELEITNARQTGRSRAGDTMWFIDAIDATGQRWYGRCMNLAEHSHAYVTMRPRKSAR